MMALTSGRAGRVSMEGTPVVRPPTTGGRASHPSPRPAPSVQRRIAGTAVAPSGCGTGSDEGEREKEIAAVEVKPRYLPLFVCSWRARRDSNPRPQPPQGCALSKLSYERATYKTSASRIPVSRSSSLVPKVGLEPTRPCGHYALNVARLPFRHFGAVPTYNHDRRCWI